ncbi:hypothetical protein HMPREF9392_1828 [Streptococcus sanguinis SK678]|nr:hypothetical protein HMPREF9392_1828 [Streptococcus sanguinis SK678]
MMYSYHFRATSIPLIDIKLSYPPVHGKIVPKIEAIETYFYSFID